jgi:hypothetical protein
VMTSVVSDAGFHGKHAVCTCLCHGQVVNAAQLMACEDSELAS